MRDRLRDLDVAVLDAEQRAHRRRSRRPRRRAHAGRGAAGPRVAASPRCSTRRRAACSASSRRSPTKVCSRRWSPTPPRSAASSTRCARAHRRCAEERAAVERAEYDLAAAHRAFVESRGTRRQRRRPAHGSAVSSRPVARRWPGSTPSSTASPPGWRARLRASTRLAAEHVRARSGPVARDRDTPGTAIEPRRRAATPASAAERAPRRRRRSGDEPPRPTPLAGRPGPRRSPPRSTPPATSQRRCSARAVCPAWSARWSTTSRSTPAWKAR